MLVLHPARATDLWFAFTGVSIIAIIAYLIELDTPYKNFYVILLFISILWQKVFDFTYLIVSMWLILTKQLACLKLCVFPEVLKDNDVFIILVGVSLISPFFNCRFTFSIRHHCCINRH